MAHAACVDLPHSPHIAAIIVAKSSAIQLSVLCLNHLAEGVLSRLVLHLTGNATEVFGQGVCLECLLVSRRLAFNPCVACMPPGVVNAGGSHEHWLVQAHKMENLLKATLPHLGLDRAEQAAQGKTALPSDLQRLKDVERLYGSYLQTLANRSSQRPASRQQPTSVVSSQAADPLPGQAAHFSQHAPAHSAASSRAATPQPMDMGPQQLPKLHIAAPAESMGEAPGNAHLAGLVFEDLDAPESAKPNAMAAALVSPAFPSWHGPIRPGLLCASGCP